MAVSASGASVLVGLVQSCEPDLGAERARESASIIGSLVMRAAPTLIAVMLVAVGTRWLDVLPWKPWMPWEPWVVPPSASATDLFAALAGFSGLFLGFYFTGLGLLVQSVYTAGSREMRRTILRGRLEVSYVQYVVFLGVLSLVHLGLESLGQTTGPISIAVTAIAGAVALVGASGLMTSGLRFLDPAVLTEEVRREFLRVYALVDDRESTGAVSRAAHVRCQSILDVFPELASHDRPTAEPSIAVGALLLLQSYWSTKGERSLESGWWPPEVRRPDWFHASQSSISIALSTGTQLAETSAPDLLWVERIAVDAICVTLSQMLQTGDSLAATHLLAQIGTVARGGAQRLLVEESTFLTSRSTDALLDFARGSDASPGTERVGGARMLDVWDAHGSLHVQLLLGVRVGWDAFAQRLQSQASTLAADEIMSAEHLSVPLRSKERLSDLVKRLRFEAAIGQRSSTPRWYWLDFLTPLLLRGLHQDLERVEALIDRNQGDLRLLLADDPSPVVAASAARRTLEVRQKWESCRKTMQEADEGIRGFDRSKDFELPPSPFESAAVRAERERQEDALWALDAMPKLILSIGDPAAEELIGHTYTLLLHRCVEALVSSDLESFKKLFRRTFWLGVTLDGRVPFRSEGMREWDRTLLGVQPALDLMALSGLALIRDDVSGSGFWEPVRREWSRLLSDQGQERRQIERFLYLADNAVVTFGVEPRYFARTGWMQTMSQALREEGIAVGHRTMGSGPPPSRTLLHASTGADRGIESPINIFAGYFLLTRPLAAGLISTAGPGQFLRRYERIRTNS